MKNYTAIALLAGTLLTGHSLQAETTGLLGLYKSGGSNTVLNSIEKHSTNLGCSLRREGSVNNIQGNYNLNSPNKFFLLECEEAILEHPSSTSLFDNLNKKADNLVLVEGPLSQFGKFGLSTPSSNRSYIVKLSDYNNVAPNKRNDDLVSLGITASKLEYRYKTEAFMRVTNAVGMKRPDEVVVIYYDSQENAQHFRSNNEDFLEMIGQFNRDHLSQFSYLTVSSNR